MRALPVLALGLAVLVVAPLGAAAKVVVERQTRTYPVAGRTGPELVRFLGKRGSRRAAREIAQTAYTIAWDVGWNERKGSCSVGRIEGTLSIATSFPQPRDPLSPAAAGGWAAFIDGVRDHEAQHVTLARAMTDAAEAAIRGVATSGDPGCRRAKEEAQRRTSAVYAYYEARQVAFDKAEHGRGGRVEGLILDLNASR